MKTRIVLLLAFSLAAPMAVQAQNMATLSKAESSPFRDTSRRILNFQKVQSNYLRTLSSNIPSVVESALGHVTLMRIAYPKQDFRIIRDKLIALASEGATQTIRRKAFTAMQVYANPSAFKEAIVAGQSSGDGLLEAIASQL